MLISIFSYSISNLVSSLIITYIMLYTSAQTINLLSFKVGFHITHMPTISLSN